MVNLPDLLAEIDRLSPEDRNLVVRHMSKVPQRLPSGQIIAANVSLEDYMELYAEQHCEWVDRNECYFYRLNESGRYVRQNEDAEGNYRTPALPGLALSVPTLWQEKLPGPGAIFNTIKTMLEAQG